VPATVQLLANMKGFVYILFSQKLNKYYIGSTNDIQRRLYEHNIGHSIYTRNGVPWDIVFSEEYDTLQFARSEERRLKNCKSHKYLDSYISRR
jgi:putative endonuclease